VVSEGRINRLAFRQNRLSAVVEDACFALVRETFHNVVESFEGVMTRSIVDALSELCSPFLKGGNSTFIAAIASRLFPQTEYRSLE